MEKSTASGAVGTVKSGFPLFGILTIVFVVAKIFHKIDWPWWLVFAPLWAPLAVVVAIFGILIGGGLFLTGVALCFAAVIDWVNARRRRRR